MTAVFNTLAAIAMALAVTVLGPMLDGAPDLRAEHDAAQAIALGHEIEAARERMERAAQALCRGELGPAAGATFAEDNSVVCVTRRQSITVAEARP